MKKVLLFSMIICFFFLFSNVYAYSSGFSYMISAMNIPEVNVNGLKLNEEVYQKYQFLIYGSPSEIKHPEQRWKSTSDGNWTFGGGAWNGIGTRGEYWILGQDYSGKLVHNGLFPDDYNSGTSPLNWNYRTIMDAEESWNDTSKYQYELQREYMLHSKLSRYNVTYDLTALDIGLDKARVENFATWGSAGNIYTEKPGAGNTYWIATFRIPPMAGEAKLKCIMVFPNGIQYTMKQEENSISIPVSFGAFVEGLSEYAREEHVKIIEAKLSVNGEAEDIISGTKQLRVEKDGTIIINRNDFPNQKKVVLEVSCDAFLATAFVSDSVLYDSTKQTIIVNLESEEMNIIRDQNKGYPPIIYGCNLKRISTNSRGKEEIVKLYQTKTTRTDFICAGQVLQIEVRTSSDTDEVTFDFEGKESIRTLDSLTRKFEWDDPKARGEKTRYASMGDLAYSYALPRKMTLKSSDESERIFTASYVIPYGTTQTLHSWNSLRDISKDAFRIDETKLFTRKENPYYVVVKAYGEEGVRTGRYRLDVAERWDELYNRDVSKYIVTNGR